MDPPQKDLENILEEKLHFSNVIATFRAYAKYAYAANDRRRKDLYTLPPADRELLQGLGYNDKLKAVDEAIAENDKFFAKIASNPEIFGPEMNAVADDIDQGHGSHSHGDHSHSHSHSHSHGGPTQKPWRPSDSDMDKLRSTLKQFVRDWSTEGKAEREACYTPMKDALVDHFAGIPIEERGNLRVLVPGAGLGRLAYDVAALGFACQGNEFSHYMLLSSYLILNATDQVEQYRFFPYVHSFSNALSRSSLLRPVSVPDVLTSLPRGSQFSLVAGDFEEIYGAEDVDELEPHAGQWNAIMTCFFIDTAKNIVNYLRIIHKILAPGGVWINLGPLLWHFENNTTNDASVELDLEEVKTLARAIGFELSNEKTIDASYTGNSDSMLAYVYKAEFWTATKIGPRKEAK